LKPPLEKEVNSGFRYHLKTEKDFYRLCNKDNFTFHLS
jgi:hypothetical protein